MSNIRSSSEEEAAARLKQKWQSIKLLWLMSCRRFMKMIQKVTLIFVAILVINLIAKLMRYRMQIMIVMMMTMTDCIYCNI